MVCFVFLLHYHPTIHRNEIELVTDLQSNFFSAYQVQTLNLPQ